jgi:hypothetical protein
MTGEIDDSTVDIEGIVTRHRSVDTPDTTAAMCIACRVTWPCDTATLGSLLMQQISTSAEPRWRGTCGHTWTLRDRWPGPCPICDLIRAQGQMRNALSALVGVPL